jgi:PleD family two-component response regulator
MNAPSIPQAETIAPLPPPDAADADLELAFEAITTLAAQLSAAPIAFISVLDGHDQMVNAHELIAHADAALYRAKRSGKNQFALFTAE